VAANAATETTAIADAPPPPEFIAAVEVNGLHVTDFAHLLRRQKQYFASTELFKQSRLRLPAVAPLTVQDEEYYPIAIAPITCRFDGRRQMLSIAAPPTAFIGALIDGRSNFASKPQRSEAGLTVNHDVEVTGTAAGKTLSAVVDSSFFSRLGVLNTQFAARDLTHGL